MDQVPPPGPPTSYHVRMLSVMSVLTVSDLLLFAYAVQTSISLQGRTANVLFASEFAILIASILGIWARYIVGILDLRHARGRVDAPVWEEKSMYLFYIDLAVDFSKLLTYLIFCIVIFLNHGFPIHILRDVYMTLRSFMARWMDLMRYRRATRNMDEQYPDATAAELEAAGDRTCIICREEMVARGEESEQESDGPNVTPKKLACGHIFHFHCLRSWLERQQACPTCRRDVLSQARTPAAPQAPPAPHGADHNQNQNQDPAQPNAPQPARASPGAAAADNTRAVFEEYFRLPTVNGDAPAFPSPNQAQTPAGAPAQSPGVRLPTADEERQRSIWGAPIVPGRFVRPPLGAAPRWPEAGSGSATPSSSQAPPVFTLPGSRGRSEERPGGRSGEGAGDEPESEMSLRHAAAAAALRRFEKGKGKEKERSWGDEPTQRAFISDAGPLSPGLGSGVTSPGLGGGPELGVSELSRLAQAPGSRAEARAALEQRLSALRAVDRQVWGLVTELSRLKSAWDFEDASGASGVSAASEAGAGIGSSAGGVSASSAGPGLAGPKTGSAGVSGSSLRGSASGSTRSTSQPPSAVHITRDEAPWASVARSLTPESSIFSRELSSASGVSTPRESALSRELSPRAEQETATRSPEVAEVPHMPASVADGSPTLGSDEQRVPLGLEQQLEQSEQQRRESGELQHQEQQHQEQQREEDRIA